MWAPPVPRLALVALLAAAVSVAPALSEAATDEGSPLRKVVTLLQLMEKKVTAEGKEAEGLYDKFMCFCKTGGEGLKKSIADNQANIPLLQTKLQQMTATKARMKLEVKGHSKDRKGATGTLKQAKELRMKENKDYQKNSNELRSNIFALGLAVKALAKGLGASSLLQTRGNPIGVLQQLSLSMDLSDHDRSQLVAFLSVHDDAEAPSFKVQVGNQNDFKVIGQRYQKGVKKEAANLRGQSQEILGILKQMQDQMTSDLKDAEKTEKEKQTAWAQLESVKQKEIDGASKFIEDKMERLGDLSTDAASLTNDIEDAVASLKEDMKFLRNLDKNCKDKRLEWEAFRNTQTNELQALSDTIKILNDDDAHELMRSQTAGRPGITSFLQLAAVSGQEHHGNRGALNHALEALRADDAATNKAKPHEKLDLLEEAVLNGKPGQYKPVLKMITDLKTALKTEQKADDTKKEYCRIQFDKVEDAIAKTVREISDLDKTIAQYKDSLKTLKLDLKKLAAGIKTLDKNVAKATKQRKAENKANVADLAANAAAIKLLDLAQERLYKFYNPSAMAMKTALAQDRTSLAQIISAGERPEPKGPKADLTYKAKTEESTGVLGMLDIVKADVVKQGAEVKHAEKVAQKDYEKFVKDSAKKRKTDSQTIATKELTKANVGSNLVTKAGERKAKVLAKKGSQKELAALHKECDWLVANHAKRKEARDNQLDTLGQARSVLRGADYS